MRRMIDALKFEIERLAQLGVAASLCKRYPVAASLSSWSEHIGELSIMYTKVNGSNWCSAEPGNCGCEHAELKLVMESIRNPILDFSQRIILTSTVEPCTHCAALIMHAGFIKHVAWGAPYKTTAASGSRIFKSAGFPTILLPQCF